MDRKTAETVARREPVEVPAEDKIAISITWAEEFAARNAYASAVGCLEDALLVAREREHHSLEVLVGCALNSLQTIGNVYVSKREKGGEE